jgi:2,3-bisphosphoglycerate-independent phosphoglycerate mutase
MPDDAPGRIHAPAGPVGPLVLVVMDGVGLGLGDQYDAVAVARTPTLDSLRSSAIYRAIHAHGPYVGLPSPTDMGNSEVGHNTMGAGRIVPQGAKRIDDALESGEIWRGPWEDLAARVKDRRSTLHLIGLLSDGGVHSTTEHLDALLERAREDGVERVRIHALLDGRDVPDHSARTYVEELEGRLADLNADPRLDYRIASGGGRMVVTMDRYEADWRIVERGWHAHVLGDARGFPSASEALETLLHEHPGMSDQLLPAFTVQDDQGRAIGSIQDDDAVLIFNFRGDRIIELAQSFIEGADFSGFDRIRVPDVYLAGMTLYDGDRNIPEKRLVDPATVPDTVSEIIVRAGLAQFACAETQKFGHVSYFWNGNRSDKFDPELETYLEIPSDRVPFDQRPWMKSAETADAIEGAITSGEYSFIRANFAGGDMVGHTGRFEPTVVAVEAVDLAISRIVKAVQRSRGCLIVTADHGNAEDMVERGEQGRPKMREGDPHWKTAHSLNPIPFILADYSGRKIDLRADLPDAGLANVAATILTLLGVEPPRDYEPTLVTLPG